MEEGGGGGGEGLRCDWLGVCVGRDGEDYFLSFRWIGMQSRGLGSLSRYGSTVTSIVQHIYELDDRERGDRLQY